MRFRDPAGQVVELYTEPERVADDYGERVVKPTKLSHVVLTVPDIDPVVALYTEVLGFRAIDWNGHWMAFLNCASRQRLCLARMRRNADRATAGN